MKYIIGLIVSSLLLSTSFVAVSAQVSDVDTSSNTSCAIISQNLRYLSRDANGSTDVSILQDFLNTHGYLKSQPTGFFGAATRRAVIAFQNDNGLRATPPGYVGPGTRAKIQAIDCNDTAVNTVPATTPVTYTNTPVYTAPVVTTIKPVNVTQAPQITSIDCKGSCNNLEMPINGQSIVHGNYFYGTPSVFLGGTQLQGVQVFNDTSLSFAVPAWVKPGTYTLYVSNQNGTSNTVSVNVFSPVTSPVVTALPTYVPPVPLDKTFQLLAPTDTKPVESGKSYNVCWESGKDNKNELIYLSMGSVNTQKGDGGYILGSSNLLQKCYYFTVPTNVPSGSYFISANNQSGSLYSNSPTFSVQNNIPTNPGVPTPVITNITGRLLGDFQIENGGAVLITGTSLAGNYVSTTKVFIGGMQATVTSATDNTVQVTVPSSLQAGQRYSMYLSNEKGNSNVMWVIVQ